jgi:LysR family glycine cleavage system transcriptional activator
MSRKADRLPPLNALRAFEAAARHRSFKLAAAELHVTPSAVSHQVRTLEEYLEVPLFRRLTRALELTEHGDALLPKVREGFECFNVAIARFRHLQTGERLTVNVPPNFAARWLMPRLSRFTTEHPEVELHLASSAKMIDRNDPAAANESVWGEASDESSRVFVRYGAGRYPGAVVEMLFRASYIPVCSPALIAAGPSLRVPGDLAVHTLIHDDTIAGDSDRTIWQDWLRAAKAEDKVDYTRGPHFSNAALALQAAIDGVGVALALRPLVRADIEAGRLVVPFDIVADTNFAYFLVIPELVAKRSEVIAFRKWLVSEVQAEGLPRQARIAAK